MPHSASPDRNGNDFDGAETRGYGQMSLIRGLVSSVTLALTLLAAPTVRADLTLHQSLENNRAGKNSNESGTVYPKGHRQKTDNQDRSPIYDLPRSVLIDSA